MAVVVLDGQLPVDEVAMTLMVSIAVGAIIVESPYAMSDFSM
jgi:hypothetical protein